MEISQLFWNLHFISVLFMTGVIWIIQLIHYPSFSEIAPEAFQQFHASHSMRITWIVGPMMLIQLGTCLALVERKWLYLGLTAAVFASTFFLSVPLHGILAQGKDLAVIQKLVSTNWPRTIIWTLHSLLLSQELMKR